MVNLRIKEHQHDVKPKHVTQALSEHNNETGHQILFDKMIQKIVLIKRPQQPTLHHNFISLWLLYTFQESILTIFFLPPHYSNYLLPPPHSNKQHNIKGTTRRNNSVLDCSSPCEEVNCNVHETLAFPEWIWTRRKFAKHIIFIKIY